MRICYLANAGSAHTIRWVEYFDKKGHDVHLISPKPLENNKVDNVKVHVLWEFPFQIRFISFILNLLSQYIQIKSLIRRIKPDIIHAHYITDYGHIGALSGFHPFVLSAWGSDILVSPKKSRSAKIQVQFALSKADAVITPSEYLKESLISQFGLPKNGARAIPWGTDLAVFHRGYHDDVKAIRRELGLADTSYLILSPRHMGVHYRIEYIVQAIPYILAKHPETVLILLKGASQDNTYESMIDNLCTELSVSGNIRIIRRELSPQEMAVLYNACDALVSIPKTDCFAISIQEGMVCGLIPVVADLEVYRQYLADGENAFFVDPENPQQIAQKLIYCIEHPELKERYYQMNTMIIEEKENWHKNMPTMEELYTSLLSASSQTRVRLT
ncbi:glycosyltransferase family 4 protein [Chloroflexota bacterium]